MFDKPIIIFFEYLLKSCTCTVRILNPKKHSYLKNPKDFAVKNEVKHKQRLKKKTKILILKTEIL